jgi:hypothetical protein
MDRDEVKEYLVDFQKKELPELVERELELKEGKQIKSIIGPRRAGKTFFFFQKIKELTSADIKRENILYINFEDPRLVDITFKEIRDIIKLHWELYPESTKEKLYIFFDEPQNIENWETAVRYLHDEGFNIFLTGSSSRLLSREIATSLRGRTISYYFLPFSFREFLKSKGFSFDMARMTSREKSALLGLLDEYTEFGGFPEIVFAEDAETKAQIIREYFNLVVYRDIVERYKIRNTSLIKGLIKSVITSFSKEFSIHKEYLTLKSKGVKVSKNTLYAYASMLEDSVFAFFLPKFSYSARKREFSINKVYLCDVCFTKVAEIARDKGRKMENVVFLELERRKRALAELFYWKDYQQHEVDFVIKEGRKIKQLVQVTYVSDKGEMEKRELRSLVKASKELKCDDLLIITWDYEARERFKEKDINFVPLWKWLL